MAIRTEAGLPALRLSPAYRERVWGGRRLAPNAAGRAAPVGEAWLVHERNRVAAGPQAGSTLAEVAAERGEALLGRRAAARTGARFPLLIKLLDTADWLSLQVHPDDEPDPKVMGCWRGDVHLRRHDVRSRVEIQGFLVRKTMIPPGVMLEGNFARFQGATIGVGVWWRSWS